MKTLPGQLLGQAWALAGLCGGLFGRKFSSGRHRSVEYRPQKNSIKLAKALALEPASELAFARPSI
jgi:hypothetical protein